MPVVTHHPTDSPGTTLRQLVKDQHPELWALHHQGLNEAPEPTVDPGEILNRRAYALQASGHLSGWKLDQATPGDRQDGVDGP